eukprot:3222066-Pleurochrysis_carterae.AAC.3
MLSARRRAGQQLIDIEEAVACVRAWPFTSAHLRSDLGAPKSPELLYHHHKYCFTVGHSSSVPGPEYERAARV